MPDIELQRLRKLRSKAEDLISTLTADLEPFQSKDKNLGFRRRPDSKPDHAADVNVTTTCSCLMALAHSRKLEQFYKDEPSDIVENIIANMMKAPWQSSGLTENNAFTTTLVIRLFGAIAESTDSKSKALGAFKKNWTLDTTSSSKRPMKIEQIAKFMSSEKDRFKINEYPPAAAVVYWFLDGVDHGNVDLGDGWSTICVYATEEFRRQRSLVVARHTAVMDPVAMAMAACTCARLRSISRRPASVLTNRNPENLPSMIELERAVIDLFAEQTPSGLWPKYFPLFHYKDAGSNFCYTFELLEAILLEFGGKDNKILVEESVIIGLERAVESCDTDRLESFGPKEGDGPTIPYNGWNSGGNLETLRRGMPESWATAVVHMFLRELIDVLSRHIQQRLLKQYDAKINDKKFKHLSQLLDIKVHTTLGEEGLRDILSAKLVGTFSKFAGQKSDALLKTPVKKKPLSALLFGPPGTSKTEIAKALAADLDWPLVEIDPSTFLQNTFQNIYVQAETIFKDVMDMYGVVVLFDELDALVQKRDGKGSPDTESKFLTTYMLPKLAKLHDQGRLIFLMATNFQEDFDDAIKRAGRFDLLLCMGPPPLEEKCASLEPFLGKGKETVAGGQLILTYAQSDPAVWDQLSLFTFGEFLSFVSRLGGPDDIETILKKRGRADFLARVKTESQSVGLRLKDLDILNEQKLKNAWSPGKWVRLQDLYSASFEEDKLRAKLKTFSPAVKYVIERTKSRHQS
jgi:hypothetical protein